MRVLHCILGMGGGGAERQLAYLAKGLVENALEVHVAFLKGGPNLERLQASGATLHELSSPAGSYGVVFLKLLRLMGRIKPDLVHTWLHQMDILGGVAAIMLGIPFVISERSNSFAYLGGLRDRVRLMIGKKAALVLANSEGGKAYWASHGKNRDLIRVVRNGIPFEEIGRIPADGTEDARVDSGSERIIFAGRYSVEKNLKNLLMVMGKVLNVRPRAVALLFGEGPLKGELVDTSRKLNLGDRVRILDYSDKLWHVLKRAKVFVSVSYFEGNPNTVLEAGACKCPLVLSDIPAHREIFDSACAWFVDPHSPEAISEGVLRVLEEPEEAERRVESAYSRISAYSVESMSREYCTLYRRMFNR